MPNGNAVEEYKDASNNMRQYGNMRFAQLTLFSAFSGVLLGAILLREENLLSETESILKIGGLVLVATFWAMEERAVAYWYAFRERAVELEKNLVISSIQGVHLEGYSPQLTLFGSSILAFLYFG